MAAHDETQYLPKDPLDLPREHKAFPTDLPKEIPAHTGKKYGEQDTENYTEVKTLLSWHAPGRPFKKRKKEFYINAIFILIALEIIIFLFHEYTLMMLVLSVVFLSFTLSLVEPHDFYYRISTEGITVEDHFVLWQEMYDFYFKRMHGIDVLIVRTETLPGEMYLVLGSIHKEQVKSILLPYLPYREYVKPTFMEKSGNWLSDNFPLERSDS